MHTKKDRGVVVTVMTGDKILVEVVLEIGAHLLTLLVSVVKSF